MYLNTAILNCDHDLPKVFFQMQFSSILKVAQDSQLLGQNRYVLIDNTSQFIILFVLHYLLAAILVMSADRDGVAAISLLARPFCNQPVKPY